MITDCGTKNIPNQCVDAIYVHYVCYGFGTQLFPLCDVPSICVGMCVGIMRENVLSGCFPDGHDISPLERNRQLVGHRARLTRLYAITRECAECDANVKQAAVER